MLVIQQFIKEKKQKTKLNYTEFDMEEKECLNIFLALSSIQYAPQALPMNPFVTSHD